MPFLPLFPKQNLKICRIFANSDTVLGIFYSVKLTIFYRKLKLVTENGKNCQKNIIFGHSISFGILVIQFPSIPFI